MSPGQAKAPSTWPCHDESAGVVRGPMSEVFAHLDDHARLSGHMSKNSWMLGGGRMVTEFDQDRGQALGSRIRLAGIVFGLRLSVEEVIVERDPPCRKFWETTGKPHLLVIGSYRMGFELTQRTDGCLLRVAIDYALPEGAAARWLGRALARPYARWCTRKMLDDAVRHFEVRNPGRASPA